LPGRSQDLPKDEALKLSVESGEERLSKDAAGGEPVAIQGSFHGSIAFQSIPQSESNKGDSLQPAGAKQQRSSAKGSLKSKSKYASHQERNENNQEGQQNISIQDEEQKLGEIDSQMNDNAFRTFQEEMPMHQQQVNIEALDGQEPMIKASNNTIYSNAVNGEELSKVDEPELISEQKASNNQYMADQSEVYETGRKREGHDAPQVRQDAASGDNSKQSAYLQMLAKTSEENGREGGEKHSSALAAQSRQSRTASNRGSSSQHAQTVVESGSRQSNRVNPGAQQDL